MNLRLLITEKCNRKCPDCPNYQYDIDSLPIERDFTGYDNISLTGGEPMLDIPLLIRTISEIRKQSPTTKIYLYTAKLNCINSTLNILDLIDGITITIYNMTDEVNFFNFDCLIGRTKPDFYKIKSLIVQAFDPFYIPEYVMREKLWKCKIKEKLEICPLPENEVFKRIE